MSVWFLSEFTEQDTQTVRPANQKTAMSMQKEQSEMLRIFDAHYHELLNKVEKFEGNVQHAKKEMEKAKMVLDAAKTARKQHNTKKAARAVKSAKKAFDAAKEVYDDAVVAWEMAKDAVAAAERARDRPNAWNKPLVAQAPAKPAAAAPAKPAAEKQAAPAPPAAAKAKPAAAAPAKPAAEKQAAPAPPAAAKAKQAPASRPKARSRQPDPDALKKYANATIQTLWDPLFKKIRVDDDIFKIIQSFYGNILDMCPSGDTYRMFLLPTKDYALPSTDQGPNLKYVNSSLVVVVAYHCTFNDATLNLLKMQTIFNDEGRIIDKFMEVILKMIRHYIEATTHGTFITRLENCVRYIRGHENVKVGDKNLDTIIDQRVATVRALADIAVMPATDPRFDEILARLIGLENGFTELRSEVAEMRKDLELIKAKITKLETLHEQIARRIDNVHMEIEAVQREVKALGTKVEQVVESTNETAAMLREMGRGQPGIGFELLPTSQYWDASMPEPTGGQPQ